MHRAFKISRVLAAGLAIACGRFDPNEGTPPSSLPEVGSGGVPTGETDFEGLASALGADGAILLSWRPAKRAVSGYAVFAADDPAALGYAVPSAVAPPDATSFLLDSLPNGGVKRLAIRALFLAWPADENEAVHLAAPNPVRFVDDDSTAGSAADGLTPATAFPSLAAAFASSGGAKNYWLAEGAYAVGLAAPPSTGIYGGLPPSFDRTGRDPAARRTTLAASSGPAGFLVGAAQGFLALDGVVLQGTAGGATVGLAASEATLFLANSTVRGFSSDGVHLSGSGPPPVRARLLVRRCRIEANGAEGIDLAGYFEATVGESIVEGNGNEGVEADDLAPPAGATAAVEISRCVLRGNGDDGIDLDLAPIEPFVPGSSSGARPRIRLVGNRVLENGERGIVLDLDFVASDAIEATLLVAGNEVRGNALEGLRLDLDAPALFVLRGNRTNANRGGGVHLLGDASEPAATVYLLNDLVAGNGIDGVAIEAAAANVVLANGAFLGNRAAGIAAPGASPSVTSTILLANGDDLSGASASYSLVSDGDPGLGNLRGDPLFVHSPEAYDFVVAAASSTAVAVKDPGAFLWNDRVEAGDDGVSRVVTGVLGSVVHFSPGLPVPAAAGTPLWNYLGSDDPDEDVGLLPGSPAIDAGHPLLPDPDGSPGDLGPEGGLFAGPPGPAPEAPLPAFPFAVRGFDPPSGSTVPVFGPVGASFTDLLDPTSVGPGSFLVVGPNGPLPGGFLVAGSSALFVPAASPPPGSPIEIAITTAVRSLDGRPLFHPFLARVTLAGP